MSSDEYDYVIVGAGSSGCVLAARLTENPNVRVLLLEAGGSDKHPLVRMPLAWFKAMRTPELGWGYSSEPEPYADGRSIPATRGKLLGGCSSINGMMYSRGHPSDYNDWAAAGAAGWSYADVLPYFRKSEANWRGESEDHGGSGPLAVSKHNTANAIYPKLISTAETLGFSHLDDFHGAQREGFSAPDFTVKRGRRASTASAFLHPAMHRANLRVDINSLVTRVVLEGGRAIGVEYQQNRETRIATAGKEVILSAGAFNTPQILLLSGIGPAAEINAVGIKPLHDLVGVGRNLQDHASIALLYDASGNFTFDRELRADRFALSLLRWHLFGSGVPGGLPVGAQGFIRTRDDLDRPDAQILISPVAMDAKVWFPGWRARRGDVFSISNVLLHPESRGSVTLRSSDPKAKPKILFNLLATEGDRASFRRFIRFTREFFSKAPASGLVKREFLPGPEVQSDLEIDTYVRSRINTAMHATSSCTMGTEGDAVVDERLLVHGLEGLRIVDCSIMPTIPGGNTNAPAVMIAEKAAAMIQQKHSSRHTAHTPGATQYELAAVH